MSVNLLDIKDDYLFNIFAHLTVAELANIASTCSRLKRKARSFFSLHHKSICVEIDMNSIACHPQTYLSRVNRNHSQHSKRLQRLIAIFRHVVLNMMVLYCTDQLEQLEIIKLKLADPAEICNAGALFRKLQELILHETSSVPHWILSGAKLNRLTLNGFSPTAANKFLVNQYPELEQLTLNNQRDRRMFSTPIHINYFLKRHPKLHELDLRSGGRYSFYRIGQYCPFLRKLSISNCEDYDISPIAELPNLTSLKLSTGRFADGAIIKILNRTKSSQSLEDLVYITITNGEEGNSRFLSWSWIRRLIGIPPRTFVISDDVLIGVAQHLPHLERVRLHLSHCRLARVYLSENIRNC